MSAPAQIDYDALAQKHGADNLDELAKKYGGNSSTESQPEKEGFAKSFGATLPGYHAEDPFGAFKDIYQGGKQLVTHPLDSATLLLHGITDPMQETANKGIERMKKPEIAEKITGGIQYLESGIPILGPMMSQAGEQMQKGDIGGGLGTVAGAALPFVAGPAMKAVPKALSAVNTARTALAEKTVGGLVRKPPVATMQDIKFGRDPARAIAREGIVAGSKESLVEKLNERAGQLSETLDQQLQNHPNAGAFIDAEPLIDKNIDAAVKSARKVGNPSAITRLEALRTALKTEYGPLQGNPYEINNLKRAVGDAGSELGAFKATDPIEASAAAAMGDIYTDLKNAVNKQVPEAKAINERVADLLAARTGVGRNIALKTNVSPYSFLTPTHAGAKILEGTIGSAPVRTAAARVLNVGNVADIPEIAPMQYANAAGPVRGALPAPAVEAPWRAGEDISGPMSREEMQGNRWVTPAGLLKGPVHGLLPGIGELAPRGEPLALPGAAELAHPEMFPHEPIVVEAPRQVYRSPEMGQMQRGYKGEMPPRVVGATAEGGPMREPVTPIATPIRAPEPLTAPQRPIPEGEGLLPRIERPRFAAKPAVIQTTAEVPRVNASGESAASLEAQNRVAGEKAQGVERVRIDTRSGQEIPLKGVDAVDAKAGPYDEIVRRDKDGNETVLDRGDKARMRRFKKPTVF